MANTSTKKMRARPIRKAARRGSFLLKTRSRVDLTLQEDHGEWGFVADFYRPRFDGDGMRRSHSHVSELAYSTADAASQAGDRFVKSTTNAVPVWI